MFLGTDSMFNSLPVPSNVSYKSFTNYNVPIQNSYSDHRNIDSVNLRRQGSSLKEIFYNSYSYSSIIDKVI